ncbi:G-type lectin S-receptor-like serine threonine-kinase At4g27290 [Olea europaea subsp. europaea]|uniref:non-specific serine/threonine protein kinase n=1 Tax=Olea europaea subsp. europaea TaxID=158383 RepID=A0A8S0RQD3_OLEEU|nr:G-type lectin S-receptor-like serine threonine-kinase At4g27290 [Olea europaea subsp. europaea]
MLGNLGLTLPQPKEPGFFTERSSYKTGVSLQGSCLSENVTTLAVLVARAVDIIQPNQVITGGETIVSSGQRFELGFFSPPGSINKYLGIWYKRSPETVVWIANRENPVADSNGILTFSSDGNLVILNSTNGIIWSPNCPKPGQYSIAQLLESGNLVLIRKKDMYGPSYLWQSFDFPTDTQLPGMKMGWNLSSRLNRYLSSWKSESDPRLETSLTELIISELPNSCFVKDQRRCIGLGHGMDNLLKALCGPNGICRISKIPICECLEGFIPISQREWDGLNWMSGCVRGTPTNCEKRDWFRRLGNVKLPDLKLWLNKSMSLKDCRRECPKYCSCTAFASSDIGRDDRTCFIWFGNLTDLRELDKKDSEQDIYFRMAASEQDSDQIKKKNRQVMIAVLSTASGMLFLGSFAWCALHKRKKRSCSTYSMTIENEIELPLFDMATIATTTDNFSGYNMIGEDGFGRVYKGKLSSGQEITVKRLSQSSRQGLQEFKNEVVLIAKLQNRNLVRLLGCCIEGEEMMLIYEYMPNKSLDYFIFGMIIKLIMARSPFYILQLHSILFNKMCRRK